MRLSVLVETDVVSLFSETLTTDVQTVLSDQTRVRATDTTLAGAFTVVSWVGIPDVFVSHNAVQKKTVSICQLAKILDMRHVGFTRLRYLVIRKHRSFQIFPQPTLQLNFRCHILTMRVPV